jgi:hypothetical protein
LVDYLDVALEPAAIHLEHADRIPLSAELSLVDDGLGGTAFVTHDHPRETGIRQGLRPPDEHSIEAGFTGAA